MTMSLGQLQDYANMRDVQIVDAIAELKAAVGYMRNAKIDLKTGATKATAIRTVSGGIARAEAALANFESTEPHSGATLVSTRLLDRARWSEKAHHNDDAALDAEAAELIDALLTALVAQAELASLKMPGDPEANIVKVRNIRRSALAKAEGK